MSGAGEVPVNLLIDALMGEIDYLGGKLEVANAERKRLLGWADD